MFRIIPNLWRLSRVVSTFARTGALAKVLEEVGAPSRIAVPVKAVGALVRRSARRAIRRCRPSPRAVNALGPAYIKFGQILSTRADIIGAELARDMRHLQDRLPAFSMEAAKQAVRDELEKDVDELFAEFAPPIAAASIAQVHPAVTRDTGEKVAVKILRPNVEKQFRKDIRAFYMCAWVLERIAPNADRLRPRAVVDHFNGVVTAEMDLRLEASAASEFFDNVADDPAFRVPEVVWHMSGRRVMTATWMEGTPLGDQDALIAAGHNLPKLAERIIQTFLFQALRDGYWHADMHQGNLKVAANGDILAVDFGIMGRIDKLTRRYYAEILLGFLRRDYRRVAEVHFEAGYVPREKSIEQFAQALRAVGEPIFGRDAKGISIARLLSHLFEVTERFGMQTQTQLILLQRSMVVVEGVARTLSPDSNIYESARPVVEDWIKDNLGPSAIARESRTALMTLSRIGPRLPELAERLVIAAEREQDSRPEPDDPPSRWPYLIAGAIAGAAVTLFLSG